MKKDFDCVQMKRDVQEHVYRETCDMSPTEELVYFHEAGKRFWKEIAVLRKTRRKRTRSRQV
jgi:hypothetical protein